MFLPFGFNGTLELHREASSFPLQQIFEHLASAVLIAGGKVVERTAQTLTFQGVHNFDATPLQTIRRGRLELYGHGSVAEIRYIVEIDHLRTIVPACVVASLIALMLAGVRGLDIFALLSGIVLLAVVAYSFFTRRQFVRWLHETVIRACGNA
jgi:hypothetical protein